MRAGLVAASLALAAAARAETAPTFSRDVAPILFARCAPCHHPGGAGPFSLLGYDEARKRARLIGKLTRARYMPPWLPAPGDYALAGVRRLEESEIATIERWVKADAPQGDPADLPPLPTFHADWQLGPPDLIVELTQPYSLPLTGTDVFRSLVIPIPVQGTRWVQSVEVLPGNPRLVHHAVLRIDRTLGSRLRDAEDPEPGFGGMDMGDSQAPDGQLLGWTPGQVAAAGRADLAWRLDPGTDFVLQLHLKPTGKPEQVRPRIGLHFADKPPTRTLWALTLHVEDIDIPAGESRYAIEDSYRLPLPVELLGVYPHAHYLGKELRALAKLPDGTTKKLLDIPRWDFNWQDQYRFAEPVALPAGTTLEMRYTYDNSSQNPRNPSKPPVRVRSGSRSTDEMGTLSFEVLPRKNEDLLVLNAELARQDLARNADDWFAHANLGLALQLQGKLDEAIGHYRRTIALKPQYADAHYRLALALQAQGKLDEAIPEYRQALELKPYAADAHYNLGLALHDRGRLEEAVAEYRRALEIVPGDADARLNLANALLQQQHHDEAAAEYRRVLDAKPASIDALAGLSLALEKLGQRDEATELLERALRLADGDPTTEQRLQRRLDRLRAQRP
ncbi:MAG TPA: tetratricopeptide repeat protein [Candidatus Polarisedimenticolaceae bacterium]|nr:tetratricopeptide repeat protein [Candidatus Polarisedimenticolaceae bacterium]